MACLLGGLAQVLQHVAVVTLELADARDACAAALTSDAMHRLCQVTSHSEGKKFLREDVSLVRQDTSTMPCRAPTLCAGLSMAVAQGLRSSWWPFVMAREGRRRSGELLRPTRLDRHVAAAHVRPLIGRLLVRRVPQLTTRTQPQTDFDHRRPCAVARKPGGRQTTDIMSRMHL